MRTSSGLPSLSPVPSGALRMKCVAVSGSIMSGVTSQRGAAPLVFGGAGRVTGRNDHGGSAAIAATAINDARLATTRFMTFALARFGPDTLHSNSVGLNWQSECVGSAPL